MVLLPCYFLRFLAQSSTRELQDLERWLGADGRGSPFSTIHSRSSNMASGMRSGVAEITLVGDAPGRRFGRVFSLMHWRGWVALYGISSGMAAEYVRQGTAEVIELRQPDQTEISSITATTSPLSRIDTTRIYPSADGMSGRQWRCRTCKKAQANATH